MKQHITKKQWNELNAKEAFKFIDGVKDLYCPIVEQKITIGAMIECLGDDLVEITIKNIKENFETIIKPNGKIHIYLKDWRYSVPALWEAIKYKVNKLT